MPSVLAIDAAWTLSQPSGIALIELTSSGWVCQAAAPSYEAFVDLAMGKGVNWQMKAKGSEPAPERLIKAARTILYGKTVDLVTIDMPIATVPITSRRVADNLVSREFGGRKCSVHSPNTERPGHLGASVSASFLSLGFQLATSRTPLGSLGHLVEVYPHPALLALLDVECRVKYKVAKSSKYWKGTSVKLRISNLLKEFRRILAALEMHIAAIPLTIPDEGSITTLAELKRYEDALDALVCAWVGIKYLEKKAVSYGDDTCAIWIPEMHGNRG